MMSMTKTNISRRDFFKLAWLPWVAWWPWKWAGLALAYMQPRLAEGEFGSLITAGKVDDFPPGSVTHISNGRFYLARLPDGGFLALYQRCTHLGCNVPWDQTEQQFICPCHSSSSRSKASAQPACPAPAGSVCGSRSMARQFGSIPARPLPRQAFDPSQVVYP